VGGREKKKKKKKSHLARYVGGPLGERKGEKEPGGRNGGGVGGYWGEKKEGPTKKEGPGDDSCDWSRAGENHHKKGGERKVR